MTQDFQNQIEENTSGQGENAIVPPEVANRFNWGVFFFTWIWALVYQQYIYAILSILVCGIPIVGLVFGIWMGTQGNTWAWQTKRYQSVEEFHKIHRTWAAWGVGILLGLIMILPILGIVAALTIPTLLNSTGTAQNRVAAKKALAILSQGSQLQTAKEIKVNDPSSEGITIYFNDIMNNRCKTAKNRMLCDDGIGYIFESDGSCSSPNSCSIIVDTNGSKEPNEEWTDPNNPKDRVRIYFGIDDGYINIQMPEVLSAPSY